jgi:hypothetical protein
VAQHLGFQNPKGLTGQDYEYFECIKNRNNWQHIILKNWKKEINRFQKFLQKNSI